MLFNHFFNFLDFTQTTGRKLAGLGHTILLENPPNRPIFLNTSNICLAQALS